MFKQQLHLVLVVNPSELRRANGKPKHYLLRLYRMDDNVCYEFTLHDEDLKKVRLVAEMP